MVNSRGARRAARRVCPCSSSPSQSDPAVGGGAAPVHRPPARDLLPAVVALRPPGGAAASRSASPPCSARGTSYRATGVIQVNRDSLLNQITSVRGQNSFGFDTPATYTSRQFNTLLGTDAFLESVIKSAGLTTAVESGALTRTACAGRCGRRPDGDELVVDQRGVARPRALLPAGRRNDRRATSSGRSTTTSRRANRRSSSSSRCSCPTSSDSTTPARRSPTTSPRIPPQAATPTAPPTSRSRSRPSPRP